MKVSDHTGPFLQDPANGYSPATVSGYRDRLRTLTYVTGDKPVDAITEADLIDAIVTGDVSDGYKKTRMVTYRSFFSWLSWKGLIDANPAEHLGRNLKLRPQPVMEHTWLSADEVRALLSSLPTDTPVDRRNRVLFQLGFTTGLRRAELAGLTWAKVNLSKGAANVKGKGGKLATVHLYPGTVSVLSDWRDEAAEDLGVAPTTEFVLPRIKRVNDFDGTDPYFHILWDKALSPSWVSNTVRDVSSKAGVPISTHDMRRSYAGMVQDRLGDIVKVQAALRHSNVGTTQRYLESRQDAALLAGKEAELGF